MKSLLQDRSLFIVSIFVFLSLTNYVSSFQYFLILLVTDFMLIAKEGSRLLNKNSYKYLTFFYLIVCLYALLGHGILNSETFRAQLMSITSIYSIFIISDYIKQLNYSQIKTLLFISMIAISLCLAITTYIGFIDPMAIRIYGFGEVEESGSEALYFQHSGMMSYPMAHALSVCAAAILLLFCYSENKFLRLFSILLWILSIRLLFVMTITTALLAALVASIIILAHKYSKGKLFLTIFYLSLIFATILLSGILNQFMSFAEANNTEIFKKLFDIAGTIESGTSQGQMDYRDELYSVSFNTFLSNPIFGWGMDNGSRTCIGEHSFVLDYLAYYGLFALLYFGAWYKQFMSIYSYEKTYKKMAICCCIPVIIMVFSKAESVGSVLPFAYLVFLQIVISFLFFKHNELKA